MEAILAREVKETPIHFQPGGGGHVVDVISRFCKISMHINEENKKICSFIGRCTNNGQNFFGGLCDTPGQMLRLEFQVSGVLAVFDLRQLYTVKIGTLHK